MKTRKQLMVCAVFCPAIWYDSYCRGISGKDLSGSLNVSRLNALTFLDCSWNQLTSLDVSNNVNLTDLNCDRNQLTILDVSNITKLEGITKFEFLCLTCDDDVNVIGYNQ